MKTRVCLSSVVLLLLFVGLACQSSATAPTQAAESAVQSSAFESPLKVGPKKAMAKGATHSAVFAVPGLREEGVSKLVSALNGVEGVLSAKPDVSRGELIVSFDHGRIDSGRLLERLRAVDSGIALQNARAGAALDAPPAHDCGGCPFRNSCGGEF